MISAVLKINRLLWSRAAFWTIVCTIGLLICLYFYFINSVVWHVADRQKAERKLSNLTAQLATFESQYVNLVSQVNIDNAYARGFKDTNSADTQFVKRSATLGSLDQTPVQ